MTPTLAACPVIISPDPSGEQVSSWAGARPGTGIYFREAGEFQQTRRPPLGIQPRPLGRVPPSQGPESRMTQPRG